jgi:hypothetical protein
MSDAGYAVTLPESAHVRLAVIDAPAAEVDVTAVHSFPFAPERWLRGVGTCIQASLMIGVAGFLLTQLSSTPGLVVQIVIVGALLIVGGLTLIVRSVGDFFGGLRIDREGIRARLGLTRFELPWSSVRQWRVDENCKMPELTCVEFTSKGIDFPKGIPGGSLSYKDLRRAQHVLQAFAPQKQQA